MREDEPYCVIFLSSMKILLRSSQAVCPLNLFGQNGVTAPRLNQSPALHVELTWPAEASQSITLSLIGEGWIPEKDLSSVSGHRSL